MDFIQNFWSDLEYSIRPHAEDQLLIFLLWVVLFAASTVVLWLAEGRAARLAALGACYGVSFWMLREGILNFGVAGRNLELTIGVAVVSGFCAWQAVRKGVV